MVARASDFVEKPLDLDALAELVRGGASPLMNGRTP